MQRAHAIRAVRRLASLANASREDSAEDVEEPLLRQDQHAHLRDLERQADAEASALQAGQHWRRQVTRRREEANLPDLPKAPPTYLDLAKKDLQGIWMMITSSYINILLLAVPLGLASEYLEWGASATFSLNFLALLPLALLLGEVTEDLALRCGQLLGGLINATFGNVVEIILSIAALHKGMLDVVAASLLGSILSNLLLVLGACFLVGGLKFQLQSFNQLATRASGSLLFLSCIGIILPTAADWIIGIGGGKALPDTDILLISRICAVGLLAIYICYLVFQLGTHKDMFSDEESSEEADEPLLSWTAAIVLLAVITIIVATCSEFLTSSLESFSENLGISRAFLGIIVLPIAGNACEHITAVIVAAKNKMDLALGVAVGSSIQIALFAVPLAVLAGWAMGQPLSLSFDPFATVALTVAVVHANFVVSDSTSNWLLGVELIATYLLIAVVYVFR